MSIPTPPWAPLQANSHHDRTRRWASLGTLIAAMALAVALPAIAEDEAAAEVTSVAPPETAEASTAASDAGQLGIELNKLEQVDDTCRVYFVFQNALDSRLETLQLELVLFDTEGFVQRRLTLDAAPIAEDKTSVKLFDLAKTQCGSVGRILVNDVLAIAGPDGALPDDVSRLELSSKGDVDLFK